MLFLSLFMTNLRSALQYKVSFFLQNTFMLLNNVFTLCFWLIFFANFKTINGWGLREVIQLQAMAAIAYSLSSLFCGGASDVSGYITNGLLDEFIILPANTLIICLFSKMKLHTWGDFFYGVLLLLITKTSILSIFSFLFFSLFGAIIFVCFQVIIGSMSFFVGDTSNLSKQTTSSVLLISLYPPSIYQGSSKLIIYSILPAGLITFYPLHILNNFSFYDFLKLILATILFVVSAYTVFQVGLRKYESGNFSVHRL